MTSIGTRSFAEHHADFVRDFECIHCGYTSVAIVRASGFGDLGSPMGFGSDRAAVEAGEIAEQQAELNADLLATLAVCPGCARFDAQARANAQKSRMGKAVKVGSILAISAGAISAFSIDRWNDESILVVAIFFVAAFAIGFLTTLFVRAPPLDPGDRVRVLNGEELTAFRQSR